jgi:isoleucyl-tRNA synthetase
VLDEQGRKMSKSLGNIVDAMVVMDGGKNQQKDPAYGADVVRLWVSSVDYSNDVLIGPNVLKQLSDASRKFGIQPDSCWEISTISIRQKMPFPIQN